MNERYERLMRRARKTNQERDADERMAGFGAVSDLGIFQQLRTAMIAIECGMQTEDWNAVAEGQAMLEQVNQKVGALPDLLTHSPGELIQKRRRERQGGVTQ